MRRGPTNRAEPDLPVRSWHESRFSFPLILRRVTGDSMLPTLEPGAIVLGVRPRAVRAGDVVIIRHGGLEKVKRVTEIKAGKIFITGDNSLYSTDSRAFGWLEMDTVVAKIIWPNLTRTKY